jgi:hypothetical protein
MSHQEKEYKERELSPQCRQPLMRGNQEEEMGDVPSNDSDEKVS